jgi:hypothetical protein
MGERNEILLKASAQRNMAGGLTANGKESGLPHRGSLCLLAGVAGSNLRFVDHDATLPGP